MANSDKVTVERSYFEALLRRADFHTQSQLPARLDPSNVTISKVEYDSLLRTNRDYGHLKHALFQGGITAETLDHLLSNASNGEHRKDSGASIGFWNQESQDTQPSDPRFQSQLNVTSLHREMPWRNGSAPANLNLAPGTAPYQTSSLPFPQTYLRVPNFQRQTSYGLSSLADDNAFDDDDDFTEDAPQVTSGIPQNNERRTLYLSGFSERTTYRDLLSVIKGGKLLSVNLRPERSATVSFLDGASEFLAWTKKNDIYLNAKRIEVKWADRQFHLNAHISRKIAAGATRNLIIHSAGEKGLTETQIRADMEHIHNLTIIDITFGVPNSVDAFVSMNSIHNALFARTCMMSRSTYKGCRIEFARDECDVSLPTKPTKVFGSMEGAPPAMDTVGKKNGKKAVGITNRFDMLNLDGSDGGSSNVENRTPSDDNDSDNGTTDMTTGHVGVSLGFLDSDST